MNSLFGDLPYEKLMEIGIASHMSPKHYNVEKDILLNPMEYHLANLSPCENCADNIARIKAGEPMVYAWSLKTLWEKGKLLKRFGRKPDGTWVEINKFYKEI